MTDERKTPPPTRAEATRSAAGSIEIGAPIERVWRALTEGAELERWFPLDARVRPGEGGSVWMSWRNEYDAESRILVWEPPHRLVTSWGWHEEDVAPAQRTEYVLEGKGGRTVVRVTTSGFPDDPAWDGWVEGTVRGWRFELASLKRYLEGHDGLARTVVYLRCRVGLPAAEAWARLVGPGGFAGEVGALEPFDAEPPIQIAGVAPSLGGAVVRFSNEPTPDASARDMTLWAHVWGDPAPLAGLADAWRRRLEALYPEGRMV